MANITETIPNLVGGVSQQTESQRQSSQAEVQINGHATIADGLTKRPPVEFVAQLEDEPFANSDKGVFRHKIDNTSAGDFHLFISNEDSPEFHIYDANGVKRAVEIDEGVSGFYFDDATATGVGLRERFRAVSLRDTTILLNTTVKVGFDAMKSPDRPKKTIVFISGVNYGCTYKVQVRWGAAEIRTVKFRTQEADSGTSQSTEAVAIALKAELLNAWPGPGPDPMLNYYSIEQFDNLLILTELQPSANKGITAFDSLGDDYIEVIGEQVSSFSKLPTTAPNGFIVTVTGETPDSKPYYLKFSTNSEKDEIAEGYWQEVAKPAINNQLASFNMPHEIALQPDGSFIIRELVWGDRIAGDLETAPWPSFVGSQLKDIYLDRNRLCLVHSGGVSMSRTRALFEFFTTTVTSLLADAPIDVTPTGEGVASLQRAIAFKERVVLFGENAQYAIDEGVLSATQPPAVLPVGHLKTDLNTLSEAVGKSIYFTTSSAGATALIEMYVEGASQAISDEDVSRHVPTYLPSKVTQITASSTSDAIFLLADDEPNKVWVYKYHWRRDEKLQSSWYTFALDERYSILDVTFDGNIASFIVQDDSGVYLLRMYLNKTNGTKALGYVPRLDWLTTDEACEITYDADLNQTTVTPPYPCPSNVRIVKFDGGECKVIETDGESAVLRGDQTSRGFYIGVPYLFTYRFSKQVLRRQSSNGGTSAVAGGRLSLLRWFVRFSETGYFRVEVNTGRSKSQVYEYTGSNIGSGLIKIGAAEVKDGIFSFPVRGLAEDTVVTITSDSFLPLGLTSVEWEAKYTRRTTR